MRDLRTYVSKHKKLFGIVGFIFIVFLECCVFPAGRITYSGNMAIGIIGFVSAIGIAKCAGEIEAAIFPKAGWILILLLNIVITILGMVARYFLEYGEVSNTYNFTSKNIVVHILIMLLLSMMFWMQTKKRGEI